PRDGFRRWLLALLPLIGLGLTRLDDRRELHQAVGRLYERGVAGEMDESRRSESGAGKSLICVAPMLSSTYGQSALWAGSSIRCCPPDYATIFAPNVNDANRPRQRNRWSGNSL